MEKNTRTVEEDVSFCTLGHHDTYVKDKKDLMPQCLTWKNDGANGPSDPKCSKYYFVQWLSSEEMYMCWLNPPGALTKMKVCEEIAQMIKSKGCLKPLDAECIYNKIMHSEALKQK
jgi:hypothetical protein